MEGFRSTTLIPTPEGRIPIGELVPNKSYVFDRYGNKVLVKEIYKLGPMDTYQIQFKDGRVVECSENQLWTYRGNNTTYTLANRSIKEISEKPRASGYLVPENLSIGGYTKIPSVEEAVSPYAMGVYVARGGTKPRTDRGLSLITGDKELVDKFAENTPFLSERMVNTSADYLTYRWRFRFDEKRLYTQDRKPALKEKYSHRRVRYARNAYIEAKRKARNFKEEDAKNFSYHIRDRKLPERYLNYSEQYRLELLQGLMDASGNFKFNGDGKQAKIYFNHLSPTLVEQVGFLARSLGYRVKPLKERTGMWGKSTISISGLYSEELRLFSLDSKCDRLAVIMERGTDGRKSNWNRIETITKLPAKCETYGIIVDNASHLFLANDFVVAHDSTPIGG